VIVRQVLSQHNVQLNLKHLYAGSTSNVFKNVLMGKQAAGVTLDADLERQPLDVASQLRIILTTQKMAPHPVSAHPRVSKALQQRLTDSLLKLGQHPAGLVLLTQVRIGQTVRANYVRDYSALERVEYNALTRGL
jgi:phosphonate transport system substrate-binding protein